MLVGDRLMADAYAFSVVISSTFGMVISLFVDANRSIDLNIDHVKFFI